MFRRLSSCLLIAFLTVLVGVKDLALGFCLCEETLFIGQNPCSQTTSFECCSCCETEAPAELPCDDCVVKVQLEVEDYLWSEAGFLIQPPVVLERNEAHTSFGETFQSFDLAAFASFEPPPPPGLNRLIQQQRLRL